MQNSDSAGTRTARISTAESRAVATAVTDPYIREQLEKRHEELATVLSSPRAVGTARLHELLHEVDSALERMDQGTYGVCEVCHDTVERERLIADPLVRLCLDHLTIEDRRALEGDLELAARIQRGLLPHTDVRSLDWHILYDYKPAGLVSGDYCDLISPSGEHPGLMFLLGDVSGKGVAASLLMSHLHAMFRSLAGAGLELDKLLEVANRIFCESTIAGQYATLICGRVRQGGEIEIASAGHYPTRRRTEWNISPQPASRLECSLRASTRLSESDCSQGRACFCTQTASRKLATQPATSTASPASPAWLAAGMAGSHKNSSRRA
jgi:serine phosphatase RsbU (regulator of sigma subunit)